VLESIWGSVTGSSVSFGATLLCGAFSLVLGLAVAFLHQWKNPSNRGFLVTLALMPLMVQAIIALVNGNLGTGVAVMGAFSLIRFRSLPGTAREIGSIFFAMAIGLATGMGYLAYAAVFLLLAGGATLLLESSGFGAPRQTERELKITIPENLDYEGIFDDLFSLYTNGAELQRVKTTNMGSLYELTYAVRLKGTIIQKEFLDQLRCRNGNLNIVCGRPATGREEL